MCIFVMSINKRHSDKMKIYGVLSNEGTHIDISRSLPQTKRVARRKLYNTITCRYEYNAIILYKWDGKRWIEQKSNNN